MTSALLPPSNIDAPKAYDVIHVLMVEHVHILTALDALARMARDVHGGKTPNRSFHERAHRFIRLHADAEHHAKEEDGLFVAMTAAGFPAAGPLGCMVGQHAHGRALVGRMENALDAAIGGDRPATEELLAATYDYCQMMAAHISVEDSHLYPVARKIVSPRALAELSERFSASVEANLGAFGEAAAELQRLSSDLRCRA